MLPNFSIYLTISQKHTILLILTHFMVAAIQFIEKPFISNLLCLGPENVGGGADLLRPLLLPYHRFIVVFNISIQIRLSCILNDSILTVPLIIAWLELLLEQRDLMIITQKKFHRGGFVRFCSSTPFSQPLDGFGSWEILTHLLQRKWVNSYLMIKVMYWLEKIIHISFENAIIYKGV